MEVTKTATPIEILIMIGVIYASYKIAISIYPIIFKRYDDKFLDIEHKIENIDKEAGDRETKIEASLENLEENLKRDLRDVVTEMRSLINEFRNYITETEILKTKVKFLEKRVEKIELKKD